MYKFEFDAIKTLQEKLKNHQLYEHLNSIESLRIFMQYHVFAVWDFMSLLKSLQNKLTCTQVPWNGISNISSEVVRLINEIVLGEESDIDQHGRACSHFSLYLNAMNEVGANDGLIKNFINHGNYTNFSFLPTSLRKITKYHLDLALEGKDHEVAASFFYGREKLVPLVFEQILKIVEGNNLGCPTLIYYFKRHIEVDGDSHGPKAELCLNYLIDSELKSEEALRTAVQSLEMRIELWDFILEKILENKEISNDKLERDGQSRSAKRLKSCDLINRDKFPFI